LFGDMILPIMVASIVFFSFSDININFRIQRSDVWVAFIYVFTFLFRKFS
jgi:hypothetical protein